MFDIPGLWLDNAVPFQGINSTVEISWDIFRILTDYRLRHLVNNVAIHIYTHDYIRMEITVLYLKISRINCRFNGVIFTVSIPL
jgi:hypothetical protein